MIKLAADGFDCASGADVFHEQYGLSRWLGTALGRRKTQAEKRCAVAESAVGKAGEESKADLETRYTHAVRKPNKPCKTTTQIWPV